MVEVVVKGLKQMKSKKPIAADWTGASPSKHRRLVYSVDNKFLLTDLKSGKENLRLNW